MNLYEFLKNKTRRVKTMDENEVIDNEIEIIFIWEWDVFYIEIYQLS